VIAQKSLAVDSTSFILKEWIDVISKDEYVNFITVRGVSKDKYDSDLKMIRQSFDEYNTGQYSKAFETIDQIKKVERNMEIFRIKLFLLTMSKIKINHRFKAQKWYYTSKNKMPPTSFNRLKNNVAKMKLPYDIDSYRTVRGARITSLIVAGGLLGLISRVSSE
jgi:hypothetical protein